MECEREEESGEMFSPNESGEYTPCDDVVSFTVQSLRDASNLGQNHCIPQMNTLFNWK